MYVSAIKNLLKRSVHTLSTTIPVKNKNNQIMIISDITGGLGNQMFQYAIGRSLSLKSGQTLRLDTSSFNRQALHQGFELKHVFKLAALVASQAEINEVLGWQSSRLVRRLLARPAMSKFIKKSFVVEPHFHYWSGIEKIPKQCYLYGYWQSERYFRASATEITGDFTFSQSLDSENLQLAELISKVNAVSLHVRRGDYVTNLKATITHGLCSLDYYSEAVKHISSYVVNPHFLIFSDDIDWVKENMDLNIPCTYVCHNQDLQSHIDMRLMSLCQHNIIANSSFSWWGAWLNPNPRKIVIAPKRWFVADKNAVDLIPSTWVTL